MRRAAVWGGLAFAIAIAAFLRFDGLGEPSYWLDEILGHVVVERAPSIPWWQWLTGVHPQHGPLYYAIQWLASVLRPVLRADEWGGRLFPALFGLASVPLLWMTGRSARGEWPIAAAALLAVSPLHVYYSREARPYALIVLLVVLALFAILRRAPLLAGVVLVLMLYTSVASASAVASIAFAAFAAALLERDLHGRRRLGAIALIAVLILALFPLLYRSTTNETAGSPFPSLTSTLFDAIVRGFSVTALESARGGRAAYVVLVLALIGAAALFRRNRSAAAVIVAMACLPVVFTIAALFAQNHFFGLRYVIAALPAYLLLAGFGVAAVAQLFRKAAPLVVVAIVIAIAVQAWPACRTEAWQKLNWRAIAQTIDEHAKPGDAVIAAEEWSGVALAHYRPKHVRVLQISTVPLAQLAVEQHAAAWLVSGGFNTDVAVRQWMCGFPVILASPLEDFRMHYTSRSGGNFLRERAGTAEWRAVAAAVGTLQMTPQEDFLFGEGWAGPEDSFRWAVGERSTIFLPRVGREDRLLRMRVTPLDHPSLPRQTMRVLLNDRELQTLTLAPGPQELSVRTPAAAWRDGLNTLTFHFGRAIAPAELDPSNRDERKLAVAFDWLAIGGSRAPALHAIAVRLPALPEKKVTTETRFPASRLNRERVEILLGRIGFDPVTAWPQLARGEARLEDLIETVAYGTDCLDDATFVRQTFTLLLGRPPGDAEVQSLVRVPRVALVGRISKFEEFRAGVLWSAEATRTVSKLRTAAVSAADVPASRWHRAREERSSRSPCAGETPARQPAGRRRSEPEAEALPPRSTSTTSTTTPAIAPDRSSAPRTRSRCTRTRARDPRGDSSSAANPPTGCR